MAIAKKTSGGLKARVNTCLNKLGDRDTLSMAANELEAIARSLPNDDFAPFLNCLLATDSSEKSPVRRHTVRLIGVLSAAHGSALSPHLSRMISTVLRRLRDPDSAVRSACTDAVSSIAAHVKSQDVNHSIIKPFADALFHEQDSNVQIGASLCLAAAVEASPETDAAELRKLLPRILKLVKNDCCKAKPNLLLLVGAIVSGGCVKSRALMRSVVSTAIEFLSSGDWAARKAAAEVLEKTATAEGNLGAEFRDLIVAALESRKFDKVKVVRETMSRALETWRDLTGRMSGHVSSSEDTNSNISINTNDHSSSPLSRSREGVGSKTPETSKIALTASPTTTCSSTTTSETSIAKHEIFNPCVHNTHKLNLQRNFRSRIIPLSYEDNCFVTLGSHTTKDNLDAEIEFEDISLIHKHLAHIESQQSNLFVLLQRFIGSSQKGICSLERRVDGLEKVLEQISQDFMISTPKTTSPINSYFMMPHPKFWRRGDQGECVGSKFFCKQLLHQ